MRILITRPREDAAPLAEKLKSRGHEVMVEPMLEIRLVPGAAVDLDGVQAVLFTSANGVRAFVAAETRRDIPVFCVGDTTAAAAKAAGFTTVESAAGNVETLASLALQKLKPANGALVHAAGNAVATIVVARWERSFDQQRAADVLSNVRPITAELVQS